MILALSVRGLREPASLSERGVQGKTKNSAKMKIRPAVQSTSRKNRSEQNWSPLRRFNINGTHHGYALEDRALRNFDPGSWGPRNRQKRPVSQSKKFISPPNKPRASPTSGNFEPFARGNQKISTLDSPPFSFFKTELQ
jgi:hypothetical protein